MTPVVHSLAQITDDAHRQAIRPPLSQPANSRTDAPPRAPAAATKSSRGSARSASRSGAAVRRQPVLGRRLRELCFAPSGILNAHTVGSSERVRRTRSSQCSRRRRRHARKIQRSELLFSSHVTPDSIVSWQRCRCNHDRRCVCDQ